MAKKGESVVLSYHDTLIYESDLDLLTGPHWLNDTIIGFYLEYLNRELFPNSVICFIGPEVTQCLKLAPHSDTSMFLDPLEFKEKSFAVMPLNDCDDPGSAGGSHWSLLVYSRPEASFFHIDSSQGSNSHHAQLLASKISQYIGRGLGVGCDFRTLNSLQQTNNYDCGVFVLCNIDNIAHYILKNNRVSGADLVRDVQVAKKRREVRQLIEGLARN
ncbi:hypothetical protein AAG570_003550 [Ranatra chinensis]|uniref:Ubiquitin-like protease family profile domain-containing protein n=1 Tax=Ranatra chinensis TaxID=642074 RepID=A0ABD0Y427_9HEMI